MTLYDPALTNLNYIVPDTSIQFVPYRKINIQQWNACIGAAYNGRPYAYAWYLDATTKKSWDALVLGDYQAVMPLPYNRKLFGFKQVYQPFFSQQLGIFAKATIPGSLAQAFYNAIPQSYLRVSTQLNAALDNPPSGRLTYVQKPNFILPLHSPYATIRKGYSKGLKYNIKVAQKAQLTMETLSWDAFFAFYKAHPVEANLKQNRYIAAILQELLPAIVHHNLGQAIGAFSTNRQLLGACFFLKSHGRIYYLLARSNAQGRQSKAMPFLIDNLIQKHAGSAWVVDFEGSSIASIARFFQSFGAIEEQYFCIKGKG